MRSDTEHRIRYNCSRSSNCVRNKNVIQITKSMTTVRIAEVRPEESRINLYKIRDHGSNSCATRHYKFVRMRPDLRQRTPKTFRLHAKALATSSGRSRVSSVPCVQVTTAREA